MRLVEKATRIVMSYGNRGDFTPDNIIRFVMDIIPSDVVSWDNIQDEISNIVEYEADAYQIDGPNSIPDGISYTIDYPDNTPTTHPAHYDDTEVWKTENKVENAKDKILEKIKLLTPGVDWEITIG